MVDVIGIYRYSAPVSLIETSPAFLAARLFRGLADPTRVAILQALIDGEQRVTDLVESVGSSQSNVSGHLACLRECGLVLDRPAERRQVFYRLSGPNVVELLQAAEHLLAANGSTIELCRNPMMNEDCGHG